MGGGIRSDPQCANSARKETEGANYCTMTSAAAPLPMPDSSGSMSCNPKGKLLGRSLPSFLAFSSLHCRSRYKLHILASPLSPIFTRIVALTWLATLRLSSGATSSASSGRRLSEGRAMSSVIASSRSFWKAGLVAARGPSWLEAKLMAGMMARELEEEAGAVALRISSMSWRRRRAKCRAGFVSRILSNNVSYELGTVVRETKSVLFLKSY